MPKETYELILLLSQHTYNTETDPVYAKGDLLTNEYQRHTNSQKRPIIMPD